MLLLSCLCSACLICARFCHLLAPASQECYLQSLELSPSRDCIWHFH